MIVTLLLFAAAISAGCAQSMPRPPPNDTYSMGRQYSPTKGGVWPKPQQITSQEMFYGVRVNDFAFKITGKTCPILQAALARYKHILANLEKIGRRYRTGDNPKNPPEFVGYLRVLNVELKNGCKRSDYPPVDMDENYSLRISNTAEKSVLHASTVWGMLRGLETFSQLTYLNDQYEIVVNLTQIHDYPRFTHRGLLLDTARHFLPVKHILKTLEAMAYNKFNVFHWHVTDDQSFPYESSTFPQLSEQGRWAKYDTYNAKEVQEIIEFARIRGIRVIPEFDTPGHTQSWGKGIDNLLTPCYTNGTLNGLHGPFDPSKNSTFKFMRDFLAEVKQVFPDPNLHIGGDEVRFECWDSNPKIKKFMKELNIPDLDYGALQTYYVNKVMAMVDNPIVWEEVFVEANGNIPENAIVQVWLNKSILDDVTKADIRGLFSGCYYLDHIFPTGDWLQFYLCEPYDYVSTEAQRRFIVGGEACMWGENVNQYNLIARVWPRASAAAEKLWSQYKAATLEEAAPRLEEHTCRMNQRDIGAQPPNGPGFCLL